MLVFKRWFPDSYTFQGEVISFDLKHLTAAEERELRANVVRAMGAMDALKAVEDPATVAERSAEALEKINKALPEAFVKECFSKYIRNVKGAADESGPREDGAFIVEFADDAMTWFILLKLLGNGKVSAEEGKDSGSPSTSASEKAASDSGSPVKPIGNGDGLAPSTATVMLERGPSGAQEASPAR